MRFYLLISMSLLTLIIEGNDRLSNYERLNREKTKVISLYLPCKITHQTFLISSQESSGVFKGIKDGWRPDQNFFINIKYSFYESDFHIALTYPEFNEVKDKSDEISFWSEYQTTPYPVNLEVLDDFTIEFQHTDFGSDISNSNPNYLWGYQNIKLDEDFISINTRWDEKFYFERYKENSNKWLMTYSVNSAFYTSMLVAAECENMPEEYNQLLDTIRDHFRLSIN